jgi:hypothetical protein
MVKAGIRLNLAIVFIICLMIFCQIIKFSAETAMNIIPSTVKYQSANTSSLDRFATTRAGREMKE